MHRVLDLCGKYRLKVPAPYTTSGVAALNLAPAPYGSTRAPCRRQKTVKNIHISLFSIGRTSRHPLASTSKYLSFWFKIKNSKPY